MDTTRKQKGRRQPPKLRTTGENPKGDATPKSADRPKAKYAGKRPPRAKSPGTKKAAVRKTGQAGRRRWHQMTRLLCQVVKVLTLGKWFVEHLRGHGLS
jgi:hypothetical protein